MGKVNGAKRHFTIKKNIKKHEKIKKLKEEYLKSDARAKEEIIAKIRKISPQYPVDKFVKENK
ncbi:MAG: hypothetical protein ACM3PY_22500 [Omnitrophica WOR_2 bacterium]